MTLLLSAMADNDCFLHYSLLISKSVKSSQLSKHDVDGKSICQFGSIASRDFECRYNYINKLKKIHCFQKEKINKSNATNINDLLVRAIAARGMYESLHSFLFLFICTSQALFTAYNIQSMFRGPDDDARQVYIPYGIYTWRASLSGPSAL